MHSSKRSLGPLQTPKPTGLSHGNLGRKVILRDLKSHCPALPRGLTPGWYQEAVVACYDLRHAEDWNLTLPDELRSASGPLLGS